MFCLVISLFRHKSMNGGEYLKMRPINATDATRDITPSISQLTIENNTTSIQKALKNKIDANLLFSSIVNKAAYDFGKRALEVIGSEQYTFVSASSKQTYLYLQKHISDACIDLFGLSLLNLINKGYGVCECYDDETTQVGELFTVHNSNTTPSFVRAKKTDSKLDEDLRLDRSKPVVKVFIEFVYDSIIYKDRAYVNIHMLTNAILKQIINNENKTSFYIFRYYVDENGYVHTKSKRNQIQVIDKSIEIFDYIYEDKTLKSKFSTIIIPSTQDKFARDEGLFFVDTKGTQYDVQIEHSEGLGAHKSNIVDFVVRNLNSNKYSPLITAVLKELGYQMNRDKKFTCTLQGDVDTKNSVLIQHFGSNKSLFDV